MARNEKLIAAAIGQRYTDTGMSKPCACGACEESVESSDHCAFCETNCFPKGTLGTRIVRVALSPYARAELHAVARGEHPVQMPIDPRVIARETGRRLIDNAMEAARPMADQAIRAGFSYLRKRLIKT